MLPENLKKSGRNLSSSCSVVDKVSKDSIIYIYAVSTFSREIKYGEAIWIVISRECELTRLGTYIYRPDWKGKKWFRKTQEWSGTKGKGKVSENLNYWTWLIYTIEGWTKRGVIVNSTIFFLIEEGNFFEPSLSVYKWTSEKDGCELRQETATRCDILHLFCQGNLISIRKKSLKR